MGCEATTSPASQIHRSSDVEGGEFPNAGSEPGRRIAGMDLFVPSACCLRPVPPKVCAVAEPFVELKGLRVTLDKLVYQPAMQTPPDRPHCFVYFITIHNDSPHTVTIKGRKWVVRNDRGRITAHMGRLVNATSDHSHI